MNRAKIVVIEGSDGSGKKTQAERLVKTAGDLGYKVRSFSFPDYESFFGQTIKRYLDGKFGDFNRFEDILNHLYIRRCQSKSVGERLEILRDEAIVKTDRDAHIRFASLLYVLDRLKRLPDLEEAIDKNDLVVGDRWDFSNWAHQGAKHEGGVNWDWIKWLKRAERKQFGFPKPDLVFYLNLPNEYRMTAMVKEGRKLDLHEKSVVYQKKVEEAYQTIAEMEVFDVIDCLKEGWNTKSPKPEDRKSIDEIADEIWNRVKSELPNLQKLEE